MINVLLSILMFLECYWGAGGAYKSDFLIGNINVPLAVDDLLSSFLWLQSTQITPFPQAIIFEYSEILTFSFKISQTPPSRFSMM